MSIQARLEGGPWDGKSLKLTAEVPYLNMPEPVKMPEIVGHDSFDSLENIYQYRLYQRMPDGILVYRIA